MSFASRVGRWANETLSNLYRRFDTPMFRTARGGTPVLLLTVPGRRSGTPYTTPVGYVVHGDDFLVCGSGGGAREDPQWFRNLRHADHAHVEVGRDEFDVLVRVPSGDEHDQLLARFLEGAPAFSGYQDKIAHKGGTRVLPVAVLTRAT